MTDLEQARRDADHARDELIKARGLMAEAEGILGARIEGGSNLPCEQRLHDKLAAFRASSSLFPK